MKIEVVENQIQYRRDCYARVLRPGALVSHISAVTQLKLDKLMGNVQAILDDEAKFPALAAPPTTCIRQVFQAHPSPILLGRDWTQTAMHAPEK